MEEYYGNNDYRDYLMHYGVKGMVWGIHKRAKDYVVNRIEARKQKKAREDLNKRRKEIQKNIEKGDGVIFRDRGMKRARKRIDDPFNFSDKSKDRHRVAMYDKYKDLTDRFDNSSITIKEDQDRGKKQTKRFKKTMRKNK